MPWRETPAELAGRLRWHGVDPGRVHDVPAAWKGFRAFLAVAVDGLEPGADADGFIVQWGRHDWHDDLPGLNFTRQLAVDVRGDGGCQPEYWHVRLDMVFADAPALADLDRLPVQDTGFDLSPCGPGRERALAEAEWEVRHYPVLRALWRSAPVRSAVTLERAD
ncbi:MULTISPECIES: hypothetical protein [Catenuloplanes]|uniref:Uncharacterized protein n=1 Tax=Catenuloplanes niger TaxID=587534 RepID=A0AAE4CXC6_9ACTN|nr:hypothetical protein [Catenuloplanes niger]MDR7327342.1 hypothetical protein [Catenuloplanes niger]